MLFRFLFLGLMLFVFYWGTSSADGPELFRPGSAESRADPFELPVRYRLAEADLHVRPHRGARGLTKPSDRTYR